MIVGNVALWMVLLRHSSDSGEEVLPVMLQRVAWADQGTGDWTRGRIVATVVCKRDWDWDPMESETIMADRMKKVRGSKKREPSTIMCGHLRGIASPGRFSSILVSVHLTPSALVVNKAIGVSVAECEHENEHSC